jgi:hypothetical protein
MAARAVSGSSTVPAPTNTASPEILLDLRDRLTGGRIGVGKLHYVDAASQQRPW